MDRVKKVQFSVLYQYIVEIDQNRLVRERVALREACPTDDWDTDEAVVNAIAFDYSCEGAHPELVAGPYIKVDRLLDKP
jgi:hypothetical protein